MRSERAILFLVLAATFACRSAKSVPEPGAILLEVKIEAGAPVPDSLQAWVYDDLGTLWKAVRIPSEGSLKAAGARDLGTVLIQPGLVQGALRIHLRALSSSGARLLDGTLSIPRLDAGTRSYDIALTSDLPADNDGDDVPDVIDDCTTAGNPAQGGCPAPELPDSGRDAGTVSSDLPEADAESDDRAAFPDSSGSDVIGVEASGTRDASSADLGSDVPGQADAANPDGPTDMPADRNRSQADAALDDATEVAVDAFGSDGREKDLATPDLAADQADGGPPPRRDVAADLASDQTDGPVPGSDLAPRDLAADQADDSLPASTCVDGGACGKAQGNLCTSNGECASGFCADGVCCTNACAGPCRSCNQPSATGLCQGYAQGSDPEGECGTGASCNGVGACGPVVSTNLPNGQLCSSGGQCASSFCTDGVCCETACTDPCQTCGSGLCQPVKKADDVPQCSGTMTCNPRGICVTR